jgi:hypothetical protein
MRIPVSLNWTFLILESDEDVVELGRRIDTVVDGNDFAPFATSALTLLATAVTSQMTAAAAIARFVSRVIPPGAGAQTRRRAGPEQQRTGRLFDLRYHLHRLTARTCPRCMGPNPYAWPPKQPQKNPNIPSKPSAGVHRSRNVCLLHSSQNHRLPSSSSEFLRPSKEAFKIQRPRPVAVQESNRIALT